MSLDPGAESPESPKPAEGSRGATFAASLRWWTVADLGVRWTVIGPADLLLRRVLLDARASPEDVAACAGRRRDRVLALATRTVARELSAEQLQVAPADLVRRRLRCTRCHGEHGRPVLVDRDGRSCTRISTSRSAGVGVVAIGPHDVGIDVQRRLGADRAAVLSNRLHPADRRAMTSGPADDLPARATGLWTRKEAWGKALGCGLCRDLAADDLSAWPSLPGARGTDLTRDLHLTGNLHHHAALVRLGPLTRPSGPLDAQEAP